MRRLVFAVVLVLLAAPVALAGSLASYTVTADDAKVKALAAQLKLTPAQAVQKIVDAHMNAMDKAETTRKLNAVQRACDTKKDAAACAKIQAATK